MLRQEIDRRIATFVRLTGGKLPNVLLIHPCTWVTLAMELRSTRDVMFDNPLPHPLHYRGMLVVRSPDFPQAARFDVAFREGIFDERAR